jgi:GH15 family glucan-1,4-alpha-glucosidase
VSATAAANRPAAIEDYALIGDCGTAALVSRFGSIDWLCWPRFDSGACFAALVGTPENGRWLIAPQDPAPRITRAYRDGSVVLETVFVTGDGEVALIDFMPAGHQHSSIVRLVQGRRGRVAMAMEIALRFDYGNQIPWVTKLQDEPGLRAIAGPAMTVLRTAVPLEGVDMKTVAEFAVGEGETASFVLTYVPSHLDIPPPFDPFAALAETEGFWTGWSGRAELPAGPYQAAVKRSLITLKALTFAPTGGIVAAPTTSLPEQLGGPRNWDYRFCWLRDATITLRAFMQAGYYDEAKAWRDWLHRAIAGTPDNVQIMYGIRGERRLTEWEVPWLDGYQGAKPVRVGNAAHDQLQLDVYGEVMDSLHQARLGGLEPAPDEWHLQTNIVEHLETIWDSPDEGMWEVRGGRRPFTFSKVMAWVALDRSIRTAEMYKLDAPLDRWRGVRDTIHRTVCREGFSAARNAFTQSFGSEALDASTLLIPMVGFLPPEDERVRGTLAAVERDLLVDGYVLRYKTTGGGDGLPGGEGAFLACSFWLADNYAQQGRRREAEALVDRLLSLRNDLGLLAEEYDPHAKRQVGNFPQAFSHVALVASAYALARHDDAGTRPPEGN